MYSPAFSWPHSSLITNQKQPGGPSPSPAGSPSSPPPAYPFCSPRPFLESSRLSSKGSQAVTCLPDPLSLPSSSLSFIRSLTLPRENSSLRYFCAILPSFNSRFLALSHPSSPASSLSRLSFPSSPREKNALCIYDRYLYFIAARENVRIANCCVSSH